MELPDFILDVAKSDISDADLGALIRGALGLTEAPKHLQLGSLILGSAIKRQAEEQDRSKAKAEEKKQRNREYMREYMRRKRESGAKPPKDLSQVFAEARETALKQHPPPTPQPKPQPEPPPPITHGYYSSGHVSSSANAIAYRSTTKEQRAFIKAFCKRPKDYVLFKDSYAEAVKEVKPEVLEECARLAVEHQRKTDGDSQKLRRPETWLADRAWLDFVAQAKRNVKDRNAINESKLSLDCFTDLNPNEIGVLDDEEFS